MSSRHDIERAPKGVGTLLGLAVLALVVGALSLIAVRREALIVALAAGHCWAPHSSSSR
mgnify:CR=1 FL=1